MPTNVPFQVVLHELAREYRCLPFALKQLPWSELKEMLEMRRLRQTLGVEDGGD